MRRDGHEVTVAAPPTVVNLERGYLNSPASTTVPETVARSTGHRNAVLMIRMMIPGSKEREMARRQMTLDEVEVEPFEPEREAVGGTSPHGHAGAGRDDAASGRAFTTKIHTRYHRVWIGLYQLPHPPS